MSRIYPLFLASGVEILIFVIVSILLLVLGVVLGYLYFKNIYQKAGKSAEKLIEDAKKLAEENRKTSLVDTKQEIYRLKQDNEKELRNLKQDVDREVKEKRRQVNILEQKINNREERLDSRSSNLDKRDDSLSKKELLIDERKNDLEKEYSKVEAIIEEQNTKLFEVSGLTIEEAKKIIIDRVEEEMSLEIAHTIKDAEDKAKVESTRKAQSLLANAIQQYAGEAIAEKTVSVVPLPNDEMKGRIIGREGRNIRAIEAATGVDVIIDDTPEAVVLSCYDPIRREIARRTLETLVADGRIQPSRIEELVAKFKKELDTEVRETGEKTVFEVGIGRIHPELIKFIGRLKFRTSYGQNALAHSTEVAILTGRLAVEIGLNETIAKRAGLLHDIGKAADSDMEGSHVDIGIELAKKYNEKHEVIDAIASHHGDTESTSIYTQLVIAADTLSAARPGARSESLDNYIKRLTKLEEICNEFKGVSKSFALQAGREVRILVQPEVINDIEAYKLARDIRLKIENDLNYPGTIKVTVIRETRVHEIAK